MLAVLPFFSWKPEVMLKNFQEQSTQLLFGSPVLRAGHAGEVPPKKGFLCAFTANRLWILHTRFKNSMLPPSQRCRDQTTKDPTGPYKREKLLNYLEEQAKSEKDWEDVVPFSAGLKRGWLSIFLSKWICPSSYSFKRLILSAHLTCNMLFETQMLAFPLNLSINRTSIDL